MSAVAAKTPPSVVEISRRMPFDWFSTTTVAPGTTAPVASVTTPEMLAVPAVFCASSHSDASGSRHAKRTNLLTIEFPRIQNSWQVFRGRYTFEFYYCAMSEIIVAQRVRAASTALLYCGFDSTQGATCEGK